MKKLCLFIFILFIACSSTEVNQRDYIITFEDSNLEYYIRESIKKPEGDIFLSDVEKIKTLFCLDKKPVGNLSGIENCKSLKEAFFIGGENIKLTDISLLSNLPKLENLTLDHNNIDTGLEKLVNILSLSIVSNNLTDVSSLKGLKKLKMLFLDSNDIVDISFLENFNDLNLLSLNSNKISDIKVLKTTKSLAAISLNDNSISDISALEKLNIYWLSVAGNEVKDITPLLKIYNNGGFRKRNDDVPFINIAGNNLDLRPGTPNCEVVDKLIEAGVGVIYKEGNIIE